MANDQGVNVTGNRRGKGAARPAAAGSKPVAVTPAAAAAPAVKKPSVSPAQFWREVQIEARKITWTSWRETWITSVMVFIMVAITAVFFLAVDQGLGLGMQYLLKLATS